MEGASRYEEHCLGTMTASLVREAPQERRLGERSCSGCCHVYDVTVCVEKLKGMSRHWMRKSRTDLPSALGHYAIPSVLNLASGALNDWMVWAVRCLESELAVQWTARAQEVSGSRKEASLAPGLRLVEIYCLPRPISLTDLPFRWQLYHLYHHVHLFLLDLLARHGTRNLVLGLYQPNQPDRVRVDSPTLTSLRLQWVGQKRQERPSAVTAQAWDG